MICRQVSHSKIGEKKEFDKGCRNIVLMKKLYKEKIFVDSDSCPVKEEVIWFAKEYNIQTIFVSSYAHIVSIQDPTVEYITVDCEREEVDLYLMNHVQKNDKNNLNEENKYSLYIINDINKINRICNTKKIICNFNF